MTLTALALALVAATPAVPVPAPMLTAAPELAVQPLAAGRADQALAALEQASIAQPRDAAVLINLGIAYAQKGEDAKARAAFEAAMACEEVIELDTADGSVTDSQRLARKALKMLARGEFRTDDARTAHLTRRD